MRLKALRRIKRPIVWVLFVFLAVLLIKGKDIKSTQTQIENIPKQEAIIYGTVVDSGGFVNKKLVIKDAFLLINDKEYQEGKVLVYNCDVEVKIGNKIKAIGTFIPIKKPTVPGQFDEFEYYKLQYINSKFYSESLEITDSSVNFLSNSINIMKNQAIKKFNLIFPERESGLVAALLLGDKSLLNDEVDEIYQNNGISHILAISGLHISIVGFSIYRLLRKAKKSIYLSAIVAGVLIILYGFVTDFSISCKRAIIMLIIYLLSQVIGKTYDAKCAIALAAIITLIEDPNSLFRINFQLSYSAVFGILVIFPRFERIIDLFKRRISDNKKLVKVIEALLISVSVQISTFPFVISSFREFHIYSILINLLVLPLMSILFTLLILSLFFSFINIGFARIIAGSAYYIFKFIEEICQTFEKLPLHTILIGESEIIPAIIICFAIMILIFFGIKKVGIIFSVLILSAILINDSKVENITAFLDVGQGECAIVELDDNCNIMFDAGSGNVKNVGKYRIIPYLKYRGIEIIDYCFISHADSDHISGVEEIIEQMQVVKDKATILDYKGKVFIKNLVISDYLFNSNEEIIVKAKEKGINIIIFEEGDKLKQDNFLITCYGPVKNSFYENSNSASLVIGIEDKNKSILLTGDIDKYAEEQLVSRIKENKRKQRSFSDIFWKLELLFYEKNNDKALFNNVDESYYCLDNKEKKLVFDIVKIAHHGSKNSSSEEFLDFVSDMNTEYVISCSKNNRYGHPSKEVIERINRLGNSYYATCDNGSIFVEIIDNCMQVQTMIDNKIP